MTSPFGERRIYQRSVERYRFFLFFFDADFGCFAAALWLFPGLAGAFFEPFAGDGFFAAGFLATDFLGRAFFAVDFAGVAFFATAFFATALTGTIFFFEVFTATAFFAGAAFTDAFTTCFAGMAAFAGGGGVFTAGAAPLAAFASAEGLPTATAFSEPSFGTAITGSLGCPGLRTGRQRIDRRLRQPPARRRLPPEPRLPQPSCGPSGPSRLSWSRARGADAPAAAARAANTAQGNAFISSTVPSLPSISSKKSFSTSSSNPGSPGTMRISCIRTYGIFCRACGHSV